ncbi:MAG: YceH family protein [Bryobacteraceae bacterium]|nr:YceH family protein [Bryobacteraceae bacterium]
MEPQLDQVEVRILGCLIEKDITTPEYYPMTMNALVNACNQKSNRDPAVSWDEDVVSDSVDSLRAKRLIASLTGGGNRVAKYGQRVQEMLNLGRREIAVLAELMLRGPQTLGELRDRAGRMHKFNDTEEVERVLTHLHGHASGPLAMQIPRLPGQKEARYIHLLSGEPDLASLAAAAESGPARAHGSAELEQRVQALEAEVRDLRALVGRMAAELGVE